MHNSYTFTDNNRFTKDNATAMFLYACRYTKALRNAQTYTQIQALARTNARIKMHTQYIFSNLNTFSNLPSPPINTVYPKCLSQEYKFLNREMNRNETPFSGVYINTTCARTFKYFAEYYWSWVKSRKIENLNHIHRPEELVKWGKIYNLMEFKITINEKYITKCVLLLILCICLHMHFVRIFACRQR